MKNLNQEQLKLILHYNPDTGVFTYLKKNTRNNIGDIAGKNNKRYPSIYIDGKNYLVHRLAFLYMNGEWPKKEIDHINRVKSDNRWANLRECTHAENQMNVGITSRNKSGYKGIIYRAYCDCWQAIISVNKKRISLGFFKNKEDAINAYESSAKKYHHEFYYQLQPT